MKIGMDTLGLPKFYKVVCNELPQGWYYGSFMKTFGDAKRSIIEVAKIGRAGGFRGQSIWEGNHTYNPAKHDRQIMTDLKFHNDLKQRYPSLDVQFSFFCEHNIKGDALKRLIDKCLAEARGVTIVNTIWQGDLSRDPRVVNEIHGNKARVPNFGQYNFSYDGEEMRDRNVPEDMKKHARCLIFWEWTSWDNGKWTIAIDKKTGKPKDSTPIPLRIDYMDEKKMDGIIQLVRPKGEVSLHRSITYKCFSDDHGKKAGDTKSNKPVILFPRGRVVQLVAMNGQVVHTFGKPMSYEGGGLRCYATNWGFEIADKARRIQGGNPICKLVIDGKSYGTVNPAHRENGWR